MKPFLVLQIRPNDKASAGEFNAFLKHGRLTINEVKRVRLDKEKLGKIKLDDYSGIILGGGPSNVSDLIEKQSKEQIRFEKELMILFKQVEENDFPFMGLCYGLGILSKYLGCKVSKEKYSEEVGSVEIKMQPSAQFDDLTKNLPEKFTAFAGHKEACQSRPKKAVLLASSNTCPVQMVRVKNNIYGLQFHPELDVEGIITRINIYKHAGYFPPEEADNLISRCKKEEISIPMRILQRFIKKYKK